MQCSLHDQWHTISGNTTRLNQRETTHCAAYCQCQRMHTTTLSSTQAGRLRQAHLAGLVFSEVNLLNIQGVSVGMLADFHNLPNSNVQQVDCGLPSVLFGICWGLLWLSLLGFRFLACCSILSTTNRRCHGAVPKRVASGWRLLWPAIAQSGPDHSS